MENIKRVPASGKTGTAQKTSNGQEASDSRIAAYNDIIGLDGDLGDLAQAAQTTTGSEAFATIFAQSFGAPESNVPPVARPAVNIYSTSSKPR